MKKLLVPLLLILPLIATANTLQFNAVGNHFNDYNSTDINDPLVRIGFRNVGQFGLFSIVGNGGGVISATYLGDEISLSKQVMSKNSLGSSISANIAGYGLIDFGFYTDGLLNSAFKNRGITNGVLGFAVLKEFVNNYQSVSNAGYNNATTLGTFDFIVGFNDKFNGDDDDEEGIKYTPKAVPLPSALPLLATAIGLFGFGANRRRV